MLELPIFVINLTHDEARRAHMQVLLQRLGLRAELVPGVDGRRLSAADRAAYDPARALRVYGVAMMDTEIACYLSHYRLWERMVREQLEVALILEDDLEISANFPQLIAELLADPSPPWLVVRLESQRNRVLDPKTLKDRGRPIKTLMAGTLVELNIHVLGSGAYLMRQTGARRLLDYGRRIFMPLDHTMDRFWENGIVPYVVRPLPVRQRAALGTSIGARPAGRHKGYPLAVRIARRWQRWVDGVRKRIFVLLR
ncbi:MAG: glycosyltransferase family 25 protein [Gammaproteobacteria bacterium]|nr:glycosyltransferase family 25 protein [Gammaproteobacteria bacterium]